MKSQKHRKEGKVHREELQSGRKESRMFVGKSDVGALDW